MVWHGDLDTPGGQLSGDPEGLVIPEALSVYWGVLELRVEHRSRGLVSAFEMRPQLLHPHATGLRLVQVRAEVEWLLDSFATFLLPTNHASIAASSVGLPFARGYLAGHSVISEWEMEAPGA